MRHVFPRKPDTPQWVMGAVGAFLIVIILLCCVSLTSYAQLPPTRSPKAKSRPVNIRKVIPEKVLPGESVEIFLSADISKYSMDNIKVFLDGVPAPILSTGPEVLKVRIPKDLPPGDRVWIIVTTPEFKTPPFRLSVLSPPVPVAVQRPRSMIEIIFNNPLYVVLIISLIGVIIFFLVRARSRKRAMQREIKDLRSTVEQRVQEVSSTVAPAEAEPKLEPPLAPEELVAACQRGECIVFAGSDLSKPAGIPTWQEFVQGLLQWAMDKKILDPNLGSSYSSALQKGQVDLIADGVARAVQVTEGPGKDLLLIYLRDVFVSQSHQPTKVHHLLNQIGFAGALTTNLDSLLEKALDAAVFTPRDAEKLPKKLAERDRFVLKLFGTLDQPETVQISPAQFRDTISYNKVFLEFVEKLFLSRTVLFVGTSLDGIQSNMEALGLRNMSRLHYALVGVSGSEWRAKAEGLLRRFSVQILPYSAGEGDTAVVNFLGGLSTKVASERGTATATAPPGLPPQLKRLQLENIGPFESLNLDFDPKWNILLGDNGVGKSNILKAIALALCGKHAQQYADRLIKFGRPSGRIVLEFTGGATNITELFRTSGDAEIKLLSQRELLGTERWLAIGFPPLRQVGWTLPRGPQPKPGTPYTTPSDMLPLVTGDLDPRMTDLKQSILNFDYQSQAAGGQRYQELLEDFFYVIGKVTHGVTLRKGEIDRQTSQIFVETDDGKVPLAAVSQGTQSLMGWIGLLLERLYEVYDNTDRPREGPALVLIDEIDAHMHPRWQQTIVDNLTKLFPEVQFIATTHSPLIVTEVSREQVQVLTRDPDTRKIAARYPDVDSEFLRADQVLTSSLFGLARSRGSKAAGDIGIYTDLLGKTTRTPEEETRLQELRAKLLTGFMSTDTPTRRRVEEVVRTTLRQMKFTDASASAVTRQELSDDMKLEVKRQLSELFSKGEEEP